MAQQTDGLLVCNAGSSSLKVALYERRAGGELAERARGAVVGIGGARPRLRVAGGERTLSSVGGHGAAANAVLDALLEDGARPFRLIGVGHRIVHGGSRFTAPTRIDASVLADLESLAELAPLHNPPALAVIRETRERLADTMQLAAFDTSFFAALPEHAARHAVPAEWPEARRYGFHGIAHESLWRGLSVASGERSPKRAITLQLGNGCSAAALLNGSPVDTSMGFTPLEGLVMATRAGDLDPGVLLERLRGGMRREDLERALHQGSGLRGLSGTSGDMRELLDLEARGDGRAAAAIAAFCYRARKYIGAYAAALGGLDAVAFGGGVGENAPQVRARICRGFEWLGLEFDESANDAASGGGARISTPTSAVVVHVIRVDEEQVIAAAIGPLLGAQRQH
jgi:acetate kinase